MKEVFILHLETATNVCSVALSRGTHILANRISYEERSHGTLLTVFIEEVFSETQLKPEILDAISVSIGPGSYTGLRIGVSVCKGIAFGHQIPVLGIPTLEILNEAASRHPDVQKIINNHDTLLLCPMIDARRMEVYTACYKPSGEEVEKVSAKIIDESSYNELLEKHKIIFFGNGSEKLHDTINHPNAFFIKDISPLAEAMLPLALKKYAEKDFEDTAYFEPFYLKDFIATIPRKKVL